MPETDQDGYCRECRTKHGPWGHLREASTRVLNSRNGLQLQTIERDAIIRQEHAAGATFHELSKATGLSRAQVQRICDYSKDMRVCLCPSDCGCHKSAERNICGCRRHDYSKDRGQ